MDGIDDGNALEECFVGANDFFEITEEGTNDGSKDFGSEVGGVEDFTEKDGDDEKSHTNGLFDRDFGFAVGWVVVVFVNFCDGCSVSFSEGKEV